MRKSICLFVLVLSVLFLLPACGFSEQQRPAVRISPEISTEVFVSNSMGNWTADVCRTAQGSFSCEEEWIGYYWTGGTFPPSCCGLQGEKDVCRLTPSSYVLQLKEIVEAVFSQPLTQVSSTQFQGKWRMAPFTVTVEETSGKILEITSQECNFQAKFSTKSLEK